MNDVIVVLMENGQVGNSLMVFRYIQQAVDILFIYFFTKNSVLSILITISRRFFTAIIKLNWFFFLCVA